MTRYAFSGTCKEVLFCIYCTTHQLPVVHVATNVIWALNAQLKKINNRLFFCSHTIAGDSASGVAGGSSLISLRGPTSPLVPILSRACSLRFSRFSIRANACKMASIFLSSRVYTQREKLKETDREREGKKERKWERDTFLAFWVS